MYTKHLCPAATDDKAATNKDRCEFLWLAPIAPMTGEHAVILQDIIEITLLKFGFESDLSMTLLTERHSDSVVHLLMIETYQMKKRKPFYVMMNY